MSGPDPASQVRSAAADAVPRLVTSGAAGPLTLTGAHEDRHGAWFSLLAPGGDPVAIRVEVGPVPGSGALLQAGPGPGYHLIRLSDRADPRATQALIAGQLRELRSARALAEQPGDLLVPGTVVPGEPRLTPADRARLGELSRAAAVLYDPRRPPRAREATAARFWQLADRLGLRHAVPGDEPAVRARQGTAAAALDPVTAAALRAGPGPGQLPQAGRGGAPRAGGRPYARRAAAAQVPLAVPVLVAVAQQARAATATGTGQPPGGRGGLPCAPSLPGPGSRALAPGTPRRLALADSPGRAQPGAGSLRHLAKAGPGAPELEM